MTAHVRDEVHVNLLHAECLTVMRAIPDATVSAIITDPPYGLADHKPAAVTAALTAWTSGDREHVPNGRGFMGREWDTFVPPPAVWDECLRVLTPGGHLLAFSAPRTHDLMGMSIRLAGFEMRDEVLAWLYGSGMPKGINVGKAIDKMAPRAGMFDEFARHFGERRRASGLTQKAIAQHFPSKTGGLTGCVWNWENGANVPTLGQWSVLAPMLGLSDEWLPLIERIEAEREVIGQRTTGLGTGGGTVRVIGDSENRDVTAPATDAARQWEGWNTALKPAQEPIIVARKPLSGTVAATVLAHGTGAYNVDACRTGTEVRTNNAGGASSLQRVSRVEHGYREHVTTSVGEASTVTGRWPANVVLVHSPLCAESGCVDGCPVAELDRQSGSVGAAAPVRGTEPSAAVAPGTITGTRARVPGVFHGDQGGASRFYPTFRYQAKAPSSERPKIDGKGWPTVKPQGLMRWLVRLVTPPGGLVLDPFGGTCATGEAAAAEGFESLVIERDPFAYRLALQRLGRADPDAPPAVPDIAPPAQLDLFGGATA